jgi:hypothetical protein
MLLMGRGNTFPKRADKDVPYMVHKSGLPNYLPYREGEIGQPIYLPYMVDKLSQTLTY